MKCLVGNYKSDNGERKRNFEEKKWNFEKKKKTRLEMKIVDDTLIGRDARQAELFCSKTLLFEKICQNKVVGNNCHKKF